MEIELHRLRQHLVALKLALNNPVEGDVFRLLTYLETDISEAESTWADFRSAFAALDRLPKSPQTSLTTTRAPQRRKTDRDR